MSKSRILFLLLFLFVLVSTGASTWYIMEEVEFKPNHITLAQDPTITKWPVLSDFYEGKQATIQTAGSSAQEGTFSYDTTSLTYKGTAATSPQKVEVTFTPNDTVNFGTVSKVIDCTMLPVAYINALHFGTIEKALDASVSGNKVFVIPGTNPVIKNNCSIESGVQLILPYENELYNGRQTGQDILFDDIGNNFADYTESSVKANLKNTVTLSENKKLTIKSGGTLYVGGITGCENSGLSGQTSGFYTQILMEPSSQIYSDGNIYCLGYIKESSLNNGSIVVSKSGAVFEPFIIYDYRGGSSTVGVYKGKESGAPISPFNVYDMPNIQATLKTYSTSRLVGYADLHTGEKKILAITIPAQHNTTDINVFGGSNSVVNIKSGGYVLSKYTPTTLGLTEKHENGGRTKLTFSGGASTGSMSLTVKVPILGEQTVSTDTVYFPVSWKFDIDLNSGIYDINYKLKFLTGSSINVRQGSTLNVNAETILYSEFTDTDYQGFKYPANKPASIMTVGGKLNVKGGLGGIINCSNKNAEMTISSTALSLSSSEGYGTFAASKFSFNYHETSRITEAARGPIAGTEGNFAKGVYICNDGSNWEKLDVYYSFDVHYNANGGTLNSDASENIIFKDQPYVYDKVTVPNPTRKYYEFKGWYTDPECTTPFTSVTVNDKDQVNLYAKWEETIYKVNYVYSYTDGLTQGNIILDSIYQFTYHDVENGNVIFNKPTDGKLFFYGWFLDPTSIVDIDKIATLANFDNLLPYLENNTVNLYGTFSDKFLIKYIFDEGKSSNLVYYTPGSMDEVQWTVEAPLGYTFEGWIDVKHGNKIYAATDITTSTFTENYIILAENMVPEKYKINVVGDLYGVTKILGGAVAEYRITLKNSAGIELTNGSFIEYGDTLSISIYEWGLEYNRITVTISTEKDSTITEFTHTAKDNNTNTETYIVNAYGTITITIKPKG